MTSQLHLFPGSARHASARTQMAARRRLARLEAGTQVALESSRWLADHYVELKESGGRLAVALACAQDEHVTPFLKTARHIIR